MRTSSEKRRFWSTWCYGASIWLQHLELDAAEGTPRLLLAILDLTQATLTSMMIGIDYEDKDEGEEDLDSDDIPTAFLVFPQLQHITLDCGQMFYNPLMTHLVAANLVSFSLFGLENKSVLSVRQFLRGLHSSNN